MKALLMHRDCDFDLKQATPWNERELVQDLELNTLLGAMAGEDEFVLEMVRKAILCALQNDVETIVYRQRALKDCLKNSDAIKALYGLTVETIEAARTTAWGMISHYASSMVYSSIDLLEVLIGTLRKLRSFAQEHDGDFESEAFTNLFATVRNELNEEYLATISDHLRELRFRKGLLFSAQLGLINESSHFELRHYRGKEQNWFERIIGKAPPGYTFYIDERDEAGARIVSDMRQRALGSVAVTLARSADHVMGFIRMLRVELAFYIGCLNLDAQLANKEMPRCFPVAFRAGERRQRFEGLYDVCLCLGMEERVVGNSVNADGKRIVIITGANQGGKSTFLRSIGLAQLMMQCGMFVGADAFEGETCPAMFTHYKREEDVSMKGGKFDEELARMSQITDHLVPNSILLLNESFAATNEIEGSEVARQIVSALIEKGMRVFLVTHLYEFARDFFEKNVSGVLFLRAERKGDGTRTFKLLPGAPLETSFGPDLYRRIFDEGETRMDDQECAAPRVNDELPLSPRD